MPRTTKRSLSPDLARGVMLAFIALAHAQILWVGVSYLGTPDPGGVIDTVVAALHTLFIDNRAYPMFAALFGYGLTQIVRRHEHDNADWPATRALLRRRGWLLMLFGFGHVALLFSGDILTAYGLLAVLFVSASYWRERTVLLVAGIGLLAGAVVWGVASTAVMTGDGDAELAATDPAISALVRVVGWFFSSPIFAIMALGPFLLGIWAGRRQVLEQPGTHRSLLRWTTGLGIGIATIGAVPLTLVTVQAWTSPGTGAEAASTALHTLTGYAGGLGYAALIALLALRYERARSDRVGAAVADARHGPVITAIAALGQRSLTFYLAQSLVWFLTIETYTANIAGELTPVTSAMVALAIWVASVVFADLLRRAGRQGPAEALLRRLIYRRRRQPA